MSLHLCTYSNVPALTGMSLHYSLAPTDDPQYNIHRSALRRYSFYPQAVCVGFVADKVALGQVFLRALPFYPISIIPLIPRILNRSVHTDTISSNTRIVHVNIACQHCMSTVPVNIACQQIATNQFNCLRAVWQHLCPLRHFFAIVPFFVIGFLFIFFLPFSFSPILTEVEKGQQLESATFMIKKWPKRE